MRSKFIYCLNPCFFTYITFVRLFALVLARCFLSYIATIPVVFFHYRQHLCARVTTIQAYISFYAFLNASRSTRNYSLIPIVFILGYTFSFCFSACRTSKSFFTFIFTRCCNRHFSCIPGMNALGLACAYCCCYHYSRNNKQNDANKLLH